MADITKEEVKNALFQMHPDKVPGSDGFNPTFGTYVVMILSKQRKSGYKEVISLLQSMKQLFV
jgi:hypothetical protein